MSNCKQCGKGIESNTGRRPREYCSDKCKNLFHNAKNKGKESTKVWKSTYDAVVAERDHYKAIVLGTNPVLDRGEDLVAGMKHLKSVEMGEPLSVTTSELGVVPAVENSNVFTPTKEDEISKLEGEMALLGKGSLADKMRKNLQKQIDKLKYS